jgi:predicted outer membrane protein
MRSRPLALLGLSILGACSTAPDTGSGDAAIFFTDAPGHDADRDAWPPYVAPDAWRADTGPIDDAQVLAIQQAMNDHIVALAQTAITHAGRPSVRVFAQQLVDAHQMASARLTTIATDASLTPVPSNASADIEAQIPVDVALLESQSGIDVDLVFLGYVQARLGQYSALSSGMLSSAATNAALSAELGDQAQMFLDEYSHCDVVRGGSPEAGLDYDAGPPVDASWDVGTDA